MLQLVMKIVTIRDIIKHKQSVSIAQQLAHWNVRRAFCVQSTVLAN